MKFMFLPNKLMMWHVDPLLGGGHKIGNRTVAYARQRPSNSSRGIVFSVWFAKPQLKSNKGMMFVSV
jgi:hypothetical protein